MTSAYGRFLPSIDAYVNEGLRSSYFDASFDRKLSGTTVGVNFQWPLFDGGLSAGRVQSVAVKLIVDREREIEAFKTEEYWKITALLAPQGSGVVWKADPKKSKVYAKKKGDEKADAADQPADTPAEPAAEASDESSDES